VVRREAEKISSAAMIELFDTLEVRPPAAGTIDVVLDNASYNHAVAIKAYLAREDCRIRLTCLPPYARNLNLIERLWW
jgi:transposase